MISNGNDLKRSIHIYTQIVRYAIRSTNIWAPLPAESGTTIRTMSYETHVHVHVHVPMRTPHSKSNRKHENQETKTLDPGSRSVRGRPRYEVHRSIHRDEICFNLHRALGSFQLLLPRLAALFEGTSTYVRTRFVFAGAPREKASSPAILPSSVPP